MEAARARPCDRHSDRTERAREHHARGGSAPRRRGLRERRGGRERERGVGPPSARGSAARGSTVRGEGNSAARGVRGTRGSRREDISLDRTRLDDTIVVSRAVAALRTPHAPFSRAVSSASTCRIAVRDLTSSSSSLSLSFVVSIVLLFRSATACGPAAARRGGRGGGARARGAREKKTWCVGVVRQRRRGEEEDARVARAAVRARGHERERATMITAAREIRDRLIERGSADLRRALSEADCSDDDDDRAAVLCFVRGDTEPGGAPFGHLPPSPLPLRVAGRSNGGKGGRALPTPPALPW